MLAGCQVSAGYDAHWRDPLAGLQLRSATYNRLAKDIRALADRLSCGRVAFFLEVCEMRLQINHA